MSLSTKTNTHILCVLHTNPGSDKARGRLGSSLQRKAKGEQLYNCTNAQGRTVCAVCATCAVLCRCVQLVQPVQCVQPVQGVGSDELQ